MIGASKTNAGNVVKLRGSVNYSSGSKTPGKKLKIQLGLINLRRHKLQEEYYLHLDGAALPLHYR